MTVSLNKFDMLSPLYNSFEIKEEHRKDKNWQVRLAAYKVYEFTKE